MFKKEIDVHFKNVTHCLKNTIIGKFYINITLVCINKIYRFNIIMKLLNTTDSFGCLAAQVLGVS